MRKFTAGIAKLKKKAAEARHGAETAHVERHRDTITICDSPTPGTGPSAVQLHYWTQNPCALPGPLWPLLFSYTTHSAPHVRVRERRLQKPIVEALA